VPLKVVVLEVNRYRLENLIGVNGSKNNNAVITTVEPLILPEPLNKITKVLYIATKIDKLENSVGSWICGFPFNKDGAITEAGNPY
jgi:hypothetical protein